MADSLLDIFAANNKPAAPAPVEEPQGATGVFDILSAIAPDGEPVIPDVPAPAPTVDAVAATETEKPKKPKKKRSVAIKTDEEKTKKASKPKKKKPVAEAKPTTTASDGRHQSGYSMLKTECDKLDRIITGLKRKRNNRIDSGKPISTVCGMHNDRLLKFFKRIRAEFDDEFAEFMTC